MSSALSSADQAASASTGTAARGSRPHIIAFDMIRLVIMVFVVTVHTLSFADGHVTMSVGAVTTLFHTSRELFLVLTALVLTYNYGHRDHLKVGKFWRRRFWLVLPAYITWSAIYYAADGRGRGWFPGALLHDLENAGARYHLYFLLISMQIYLLFPVIRWVLRKTEGHHAWLFGAAVVYQVALTCSLHYDIGRHGHSLYAQWLNGAGQGIWVETYVLYVAAGAIVGWHFEELCEFTRRHFGTWPRIAAVAVLGVAVGIAVYLTEIEVYGATPNNASAVFQPVEIFETLAFGMALLGAGLLWGDRGAPARKFAAAGAASSFGIYLVHPLILQGLLRVMGWHYLGADGGLLGALHRIKHSSIEVLVVLFIMVPVIYAISWVISSAARRTPLSLMLTGREYARPDRGTANATLNRLRRGLTRGTERVVAVSLVAVSLVGIAGLTGAQAYTKMHEPFVSTAHTIHVGGMTRSYTVLAPKTALPASAPIIMVLSGINANQPGEIKRDQFMPYVKAGKAELVYPLAYRESWNAIGCCSWAAKAGVDDTGFITSLVPVVDPGHKHPIYIVGYSNGGRLAYRLDCTNPLLFDGTIIVKADPMPGCTVVVPMKIMTIAAMNDDFVPYKPGDKGREKPPATVQIARLRASSQCSSKSVKEAQGNMTYTLWPDCANGTSVGFTVYKVGVHSYPRPPVSYPSASQVSWAFINGTMKILPEPKAS